MCYEIVIFPIRKRHFRVRGWSGAFSEPLERKKEKTKCSYSHVWKKIRPVGVFFFKEKRDFDFERFDDNQENANVLDEQTTAVTRTLCSFEWFRMRSENDRDSNVHQIVTCPSNGDTQSPRYSTPGALVKVQSRQLICTTREYTGTINFDWGRFLEKSNLVWKGSGVGN